jgi:heterodisulfide reductase subunit B2
MSEYKLFPGCVIQNRYPFLEASAKIVFDQLGVKYSPAEFGCCPNPVGLKFVDQKTWAVLAARNCCEAEKEGKDIMSLCNGCNQSMAVAQYQLKHDAILKKEVNAVLSKVGKEYKGTSNNVHFVNILMEEVGIDKIKAAITKPLTGLKVACHPGCHYMRPSHILNGEDPMKPEYLHKLVEATGATVVEFDQELVCCGNVVRNSDEATANNMLKSKIDGARLNGADMIAVNCPACFTQLDGEQSKLKALAEEGVTYKFPIFYITELIALAMGKGPKDIGINFHRNKGKDALGKVGL